MKFDSYPTLNKFLMPILVLAALLGSYLVAQATGFWAVSGKAMLDLENLTSSADIRGWMTLEQVIQGFGIPQAELYAALAIPAGLPASTALKDLEGILPGFEVTLVRQAVDAFLGSSPPVVDQPPVETPLPPTPTPAPVLTPQPTAHLPQGSGTGEGDGAGPTPLPAGQILPASEIKGRHTLNDIAGQCQVDLAELLAALNLPADTDLNLALKDLVEQGVISEIQVVRDAVAKLQNQ
jgi:hypothetical protein